MARPVRLALVALVALVLALGVALLASAATDRPEKTVTVGATVPGPKREVWRVLADFERYGEWNPVIRRASGRAREGTSLELELALPGQDPEKLEPEVLIARPERKLRWQDRLVVPGLRDWEYEFVLQPVENGRVLVVQQLRAEGLLAPLADAGDAREALELIADALEQRLSQG